MRSFERFRRSSNRTRRRALWSSKARPESARRRFGAPGWRPRASCPIEFWWRALGRRRRRSRTASSSTCSRTCWTSCSQGSPRPNDERSRSRSSDEILTVRRPSSTPWASLCSVCCAPSLHRSRSCLRWTMCNGSIDRLPRCWTSPAGDFARSGWRFFLPAGNRRGWTRTGSSWPFPRNAASRFESDR